MLSKKFISAVRLSSRRAYEIAWAAGLHPSTLSKLMNGIERIKPMDPRIIAVGRSLGLKPEDCFDCPDREPMDAGDRR